MEEIFEKLEWLDSDEIAIQHEISKTNFLILMKISMQIQIYQN
jgi:hypothetical protein